MKLKQGLIFVLLFIPMRIGWYIFLPQTLADTDMYYYVLATGILLVTVIILLIIQQENSLDFILNFSLMAHVLSLEILSSQVTIFLSMLFIVIGLYNLINLSKEISFEDLFSNSAFPMAIAVMIDSSTLPILFILFIVILLKEFRIGYLTIPFVALGAVWLITVAWHIIWGADRIWQVYQFDKLRGLFSGISTKIATPEHLLLIGFSLFSMIIYTITKLTKFRKTHKDEHVLFRIIMGAVLLFISLGQDHRELYLALPIAIFLSRIMIQRKFKKKYAIIIRLIPALLYVIATILIKII